MSVRAALVGVMLACLVVVVGGILWLSRDSTIYAPGFSEEKFALVRPGMTSEDVHALLGEPLTTQPANPGEVWTYGDPENHTRAKVEMSGLEVVSFSTTGIVDRYYGRSSAVNPGMSKEAVIAELGEPTRVTIVRDEKREYYTVPNTYGLNEMRAIGFDSSGKVTEAYRSSMYD